MKWGGMKWGGMTKARKGGPRSRSGVLQNNIQAVDGILAVAIAALAALLPALLATLLPALLAGLLVLLTGLLPAALLLTALTRTRSVLLLLVRILLIGVIH
jgi:hypothetical protein